MKLGTLCKCVSRALYAFLSSYLPLHIHYTSCLRSAEVGGSVMWALLSSRLHSHTAAQTARLDMMKCQTKL